MHRFKINFTDTPDLYSMDYIFNSQIDKDEFVEYLKEWIRDAFPTELKLFINYFTDLDLFKMAYETYVFSKPNPMTFVYSSLISGKEKNDKLNHLFLELIEAKHPSHYKDLINAFEKDFYNYESLIMDFIVSEETNNYHFLFSFNEWLILKNLGKKYIEDNVSVLSFDFK